MIKDRNELMTHCWPELRKFCAERHVELTEVDLRWGISEEQSARKETLKLCLGEIRACRPFFIGLLGERYGWIPGDEAFTSDLKQEQPWLKDIYGKSVTELEILHGVLNNPEMAGRAFFYFRDPEYAKDKGDDFLSENKESEEKQTTLKDLIRKTCLEKQIPLHEAYRNPQELASLILEELKTAIEIQFPIEDIPDPLDREALDHEAFAEIRRRTYIGRRDYYQVLDNHCNGDGTPLLLLGDAGSGKSALFANWVAIWRKEHPKDFIFQHYIGGTPDSSSHWKLMTRLMKEIKRWTEDTGDLPKTNDDILRDFPIWLAKSRIKAENNDLRFIIILDALNQLDNTDRGRLLGWLPEHSFTGALRLLVSTLPGETFQAVEKRNWQTLCIQPLPADERKRMIVEYLKRFGKKLDDPWIDRLSEAPSAANPLYLKILLDELRVTGTFDNLYERLSDYLEAPDIPSLLKKVLKRYQKDYERDRPELVGDALGLIWAARRGLTENELLKLLKPGNLPQLPLATWAPLRAALEEGLVSRGGVLNFAHDFLRIAVEITLLPDLNKKNNFKIQLADYFETQQPTARSCDELPWLLRQTGLSDRLRSCLLNIDCFHEIRVRDIDELLDYWVYLGEEKSMGLLYINSIKEWSKANTFVRVCSVANELGIFFINAALYSEAERLIRSIIKLFENFSDVHHLNMATIFTTLGRILKATNRMNEAEEIYRRSLNFLDESIEEDRPVMAVTLDNLASLLTDTHRLTEAESLHRRALKIFEESLGKNHPDVAYCLNNLANLCGVTNRIDEAELLHRRALKIWEERFGKNHPNTATTLDNFGRFLQSINRIDEAELLHRRALKIFEESLGKDHPDVAICLINLANLCGVTNRIGEAVSLSQRAVEILINSSRTTGHVNPNLKLATKKYTILLEASGCSWESILTHLREIALEVFK